MRRKAGRTTGRVEGESRRRRAARSTWGGTNARSRSLGANLTPPMLPCLRGAAHTEELETRNFRIAGGEKHEHKDATEEAEAEEKCVSGG